MSEPEHLRRSKNLTHNAETLLQLARNKTHRDKEKDLQKADYYEILEKKAKNTFTIEMEMVTLQPEQMDLQK